MAVDTEQKRWSMLAWASGVARTHVFNPETSGLSSIEKITVLQHYGGVAWASPVVSTGRTPQLFRYDWVWDVYD